MTTAATPQKVAKDVAAFFAANPERWTQGYAGSRETLCCIQGAAMNYSLSERVKFRHAFFKVHGTGPAEYNDVKGRTVEQIVAALRLVEALP